MTSTTTNKTPDPERVAALVHDMRVDRAWTQRELADHAGVHINTIGKVERGQGHACAALTYTKIARAFGMTRRQLLAHAAATTDTEVA